MKWNLGSIGLLILISFMFGWGCSDLQFKDWFGWIDIGISLIGFIVLRYYMKDMQ